MRTPEISIILPVYNGEAWLREAILSTLQAANKVHAEIIILDDGSTDGTMDIINDCKVHSHRTTYQVVHNSRNIGIVDTLNKGLDIAEGRYIARMDADDVCMPSRFVEELSFLRKTGIDLCGSWFVEFGQGISRIVRWSHSEPAVRAALLFQNTILHPSIMARRELFDHLRYRKEYQLAEDYDLFARAMMTFRMANIPKALLRYRRHRMQATKFSRDEMESVTERIRLEALRSSGINPSPIEIRVHNLIRSPRSIHTIEDLDRIESWLIKLMNLQPEADSRMAIASQWTRACIRAAPLGSVMRRTYFRSPLYKAIPHPRRSFFNLAILSMLKLEYQSMTFSILQRFGLRS